MTVFACTVMKNALQALSFFVGVLFKEQNDDLTRE